MENNQTPSYSILRTQDYPNIGDQLDDLFKQGAFSAEMTAKIQSVKDKYPKVGLTQDEIKALIG
jgi:hypothetical protein